MPKYAEKICNMCTLLKYAKIRQSAKYAEIAYSHFSHMPRWVSLKADRTTAHDRTVRPLCGRAVGPR